MRYFTSSWHRHRGHIGAGVMYMLMALTICLSCQSDSESAADLSLRGFYYPYAEFLTEPKVYLYESTQAHHPPEIWVYQSLVMGEDTLLISRHYDGAHRLSIVQIDQPVDNGVLMKTLQLIHYDSLGGAHMTEAEVQQGAIFHFQRTAEDELLLCRLAYDDPAEPGARVSLTRNRYYRGEEPYVYGEDTLAAVRYHMNELIEQEKIGTLDLELESTELYARGIGRIYHRRSLGAQQFLEYRLVERLSLESFEGRYGALIDPFTTAQKSS